MLAHARSLQMSLPVDQGAARTGRGPRPAVMTVAPLFPPAVGYIAGVLVEAAADPPFVGYCLLLAAGTVAAALRVVRAWSVLLVVFVAGIAAGGAMYHATSCPSPVSIERFATGRGTIVRVRGVVASAPAVTRADPGPLSIAAFRARRTRFLLDVASVRGRRQNIPVDGAVRVTVREPVLDLVRGERVEVQARLHALRPPANPGAFDWAGFMRRRGVVATMVCGHRESIVRLSPPGAARVDLVNGLRAKLRSWLIDDLVVAGDEEANLLAAMVLGHRTALDRQINEAFIRAGCAHFLAVSGVHVVIVILIASVGCRALLLRRRQRLLVLMIVVAGYACCAEPRPSILRASIIAEIYFLACLIHRERARLNWISATVLVLGVVDPGMVFDVGYQLSTSAVLGISFLTPALRRAVLRVHSLVARSPDRDAELRRRLIASGRPPWRRRMHAALASLRHYLTEGLIVSAAAWLATWPIVATHFWQVHPFGPVATIIMMPLLTLLMAAGFAKLLLSAVAPFAAGWLVAVLNMLDTVGVRAADAFGSVPGATMTCSPPPWFVLLAYYACIVAWCAAASRVIEPVTALTDRLIVPPRGMKDRRAAVGATVAAALAFGVWCMPRAAPGRLTVTVLAVGAGSATVLELPDGKVVLYDAGTLGSVDVGRHVVLPFLRHRGIRRIDRIYVSHANLDHYNGLPTIASAIPCGVLYVNSRFSEEAGAASLSQRLLKRVASAGCAVRVLDGDSRQWTFGGAAFEWLWPPADRSIPMKGNDASTVLRVSYAGRSVLLPGDIEDVGQQALLATAGVSADVLVLPHHGGVRSSSAAFFDAVGPSIMVRSSNEPMAETYNGLASLVGAARLLNTADIGAVTIVLNDGGVRAAAFRAGASDFEAGASHRR